MHRNSTLTKQGGISFAEALVAMVILAVCLAPALDALSASTRGPAAATSESELACAKSHLETVMAEPYSSLLRAAMAAGSVTKTTSYSVGVDPVCPAREVFIGRYNPDNTANAFPSADTGLLYLKVSVPNGTASFSTLVTRQ